jgi:hypothetical protein
LILSPTPVEPEFVRMPDGKPLEFESDIIRIAPPDREAI